MSPNIGEISQMNSVCTDYTSLLASEDFKRVLSIVLQKSWVYNSESIQAIFEKLWNSENLTEDEQNTLESFCNNKNIETSVRDILENLSNTSFSWELEVWKMKEFVEFVDTLFGENGFDVTKQWILELAGIDCNEQVTTTLTLSSQAQARQEALNNWSEKNPKLAKSLEWKITIDNNGISIQTESGKLPFGFESVIWGQRFDVERYPKGTFTRDQLTALILMLWGRIYNTNDSNADAWKEAVSFFTEVLWLETWKFYWSSSRHENHYDVAWGLHLCSNEVYVSLYYRYSTDSAFTSQNF